MIITSTTQSLLVSVITGIGYVKLPGAEHSVMQESRFLHLKPKDSGILVSQLEQIMYG